MSRVFKKTITNLILFILLVCLAKALIGLFVFIDTEVTPLQLICDNCKKELKYDEVYYCKECNLKF